MPDSTVRAELLEPRPLNRFGPIDSAPTMVRRAEDAHDDWLRETLGIGPAAAPAVLAAARRPAAPMHALGAVPELTPDLRERTLRTLIHPGDERLVVTDVVPVDQRIMSGEPFALRVRFAAAPLNPPRLVRVAVEWAGDTFANELLLEGEDAARGYVDVPFGEDQTLPVGAASFEVTLYNALGARARFRTTCAVLPSNPFSLDLGPDGAFVTGTWSARGVRHGDAYDTGIAVTLSNGDAGAVRLPAGFHWKFWDGGVGGTLVEEGDGAFPGGTIEVPGHNTWRGTIGFHSPRNSGIFNHYEARNDMTIEIIMSGPFGPAGGAITCRTMFRYGVNITRVSTEDFTNQEYTDLGTAVNRMRTIYERRNMTFDVQWRGIARASVGGYQIIDSFAEFHQLLADWSGPDTDQNIDAFIVQSIAIAGTGVDGIDGSIPGPTSHAGPDSGVTASKCGYVDASGVRRLHSEYLGMLIGHELGHYLGLVHVGDAGNLMLPSSGTDDIALTYGQYDTMIHHGWVRID